METRQAQLFMNIFESYRGIEFRRIAHQVMVFDWKDFDDWTERYNERTNPEVIAAFSSRARSIQIMRNYFQQLSQNNS